MGAADQNGRIVPRGAGVLSLAALSLALWGGEPWNIPDTAAVLKNPVAGDDTALKQGKQIYEDRCADCHGPKGKGDGPAAVDLDPKPGDLSKPTLREQADGVLFWKISEGKKPMPPYKTKLSEEQRWQTVNYIRTLAGPDKKN
jgi:mono/diheme cytochrome c family protein